MTEDELTKEPTPQPTVTKKRKRGRPKGKKRAPRKEAQPVQAEAPVPQSVVNIESAREKILAETINEARGYSEEELDSILLGLESQGNAYDWVRNMDEFRLPEPLQKLVDSGEQAFRWIDTLDDTCMMQITRENFRWTPVNQLSHGKYFKERERRTRFNKHGGIMSGYMLLCWMPGRLYDKWCQVKSHMSRTESPMDKPSKVPGVQTYDPVAEGTATNAAETPAGADRFSGVVHVAEDTHPDTSYEEQGEYT